MMEYERAINVPKMSSGSIVGSKHVDQRKLNKIELERNVQKTNKNLAKTIPISRKYRNS